MYEKNEGKSRTSDRFTFQVFGMGAIILITIGLIILMRTDIFTGPSSESEAKGEHISTEMQTPEYDPDYITRTEITFPITLDCRDTGKRFLFLMMELPEEMRIRAKDKNWILISENTEGGICSQTYAYRSCPSGGERILFTPIVETVENGFTEEMFSEIHAAIYYSSLFWMEIIMQEMVESGELEKAINLEPDEAGKVSDEALKVVYEIYEIIRNESVK